MREIKFRGFDIENGGIWRYGYFLKDNEGNKRIIDNVPYATGSISEIISYRCKHIGQYTGLKDKNGKEIYEGDILKVLFEEARIGASKKYYHYVVKYQDLEASFDLFENEELLGKPCFVSVNQSIFEVIGNIYENPNLLRKS